MQSYQAGKPIGDPIFADSVEDLPVKEAFDAGADEVRIRNGGTKAQQKPDKAKAKRRRKMAKRSRARNRR